MGVNNKASPPGRHQEQAPKQRCTFSPTTFSSVQTTGLDFFGYYFISSIIIFKVQTTLLWVLFYFFDHYIQSSDHIPYHTLHTRSIAWIAYDATVSSVQSTVQAFRLSNLGLTNIGIDATASVCS